MRALGAQVGVFVDGAAECECGVIVQDGEEEGEGEFELGVEELDGGVLQEKEGLDLLEEGWGEGLIGGGVRVCHVHSTFVLGWGVVEWCGVEVAEIVTGERLVFCKWLRWLGEWVWRVWGGRGCRGPRGRPPTAPGP